MLTCEWCGVLLRAAASRWSKKCAQYEKAGENSSRPAAVCHGGVQCKRRCQSWWLIKVLKRDVTFSPRIFSHAQLIILWRTVEVIVQPQKYISSSIRTKWGEPCVLVGEGRKSESKRRRWIKVFEFSFYFGCDRGELWEGIETAIEILYVYVCIYVCVCCLNRIGLTSGRNLGLVVCPGLM